MKKSKKQRTDDEDSGGQTQDEEDPPMPRHRVTTKGTNVPEHAETFQAFQEQYNMSPVLLSNLKQSGYKHPTGIQSYGIPILMEVCRSYSTMQCIPAHQQLTVQRPRCHFANWNRKDAVISATRHVAVGLSFLSREG